MRKRSFLLVAGACLATLSLAVGSALADPSGTPTFRNLAGSGSDTTQGVMNALSQVVTIGGVKQIGSYDAGTAATPTMSTKSTAACTNITRPSGSNNGIIALVNDRNTVPQNHCLQFARSSTDNHTSHVGDHLTYIPFATDAVTYAVRGPGPSGGSSINRNLPVSVLLKIYQCDPAFAADKPLLPQFGSGTRKFFLENILHVPSGDVANYAGPGGLFPCVSDKDASGNPLLENTGNLLTSDAQIEPYSVSSYIAQTTNNVTDVHGFALLGNIAGNPSLAINTTATGVRPVFNVVPNVLVQGPSNSKTVFVGPSSLVCQNTATILKQGFAANASCGDTTTQSDSALGADTVGSGE